MRMIGKLFVWFCVATVLAQVIVLCLALAKGNLGMKQLTQTIALLNGIDISGQRLQAILQQNRTIPVPTREEIVASRAAMSRELQMREEALKRESEIMTELRKQLEIEKSRFDERRVKFEERLAGIQQGMEDSSLGEIQRTLQSLSPDQAKDQLLRFWKGGQQKDVVAILQGMPIDKKKKIMGEFTQEAEQSTLNEMLVMLRQGEPTASLLKEAREDSKPPEDAESEPAPPAEGPLGPST